MARPARTPHPRPRRRGACQESCVPRPFADRAPEGGAGQESTLRPKSERAGRAPEDARPRLQGGGISSGAGSGETASCPDWEPRHSASPTHLQRRDVVDGGREGPHSRPPAAGARRGSVSRSATGPASRPASGNPRAGGGRAGPASGPRHQGGGGRAHLGTWRRRRGGGSRACPAALASRAARTAVRAAGCPPARTPRTVRSRWSTYPRSGGAEREKSGVALQNRAREIRCRFTKQRRAEPRAGRTRSEAARAAARPSTGSGLSEGRVAVLRRLRAHLHVPHVCVRVRGKGPVPQREQVNRVDCVPEHSPFRPVRPPPPAATRRSGRRWAGRGAYGACTRRGRTGRWGARGARKRPARPRRTATRTGALRSPACAYE